MTTHYIDILPDGFDPASLTIAPGDSVIWTNTDANDHTATEDSENRFDEYVEAGADSEEVEFSDSDAGKAYTYYCKLHTMEPGTVIVEELEEEAEDGPKTAAGGEPAGIADPFSRRDWQAMGRVIAANWAFDLASDIKHALDSSSGSQHQRMARRWNEVKQWWMEEVGTQNADFSPTDLLKHDQLPLDQLAQRLRAAWVGFKRARLPIKKHPNPDPSNAQTDPDWGQSKDPFGKAITVLPRPRLKPGGGTYSCADPSPKWTEIGVAFLCRVNPYAIATYYGFIEKLEQGIRITQADRDEYDRRKAAVSARDYQILAVHQSTRLLKYWKTQRYDEAKFIDDMWRMTFRGEWQSQERALWHWLRFIDMYLPVRSKASDAPLPDLLTVSIEKGGGQLPPWAIATGAFGILET